MQNKLPELKSRTVTPERIANQLRVDIITQKLSPKEKFVEMAIADRFSASRGSVRIALQTIEGEGLIQTLPNGRKEVVGFSQQQAEDVYAFRWMVENCALDIAINKYNSYFGEIVLVLQRIEAACAKPIEQTDWFDLDIQFHRALMLSGNNMPLLKAWEVNIPIIYALMSINTVKGYLQRYIEEFYDKHKSLFEQMITRNPSCYDELRQHILDAQTISKGVLG